MKRCHLGARQLARLSGVSAGTVMRWRGGDQIPLWVQAVVRLFEVDPASRSLQRRRPGRKPGPTGGRRPPPPAPKAPRWPEMDARIDAALANGDDHIPETKEPDLGWIKDLTDSIWDNDVTL
jgi:hypothetical protein